MEYIIMAIIIIIVIAKVTGEDKKLKTKSDPNAEGYDNTRLTIEEKYNYEEIYLTGVNYYTSNIDKFMKKFPHPDWDNDKIDKLVHYKYYAQNNALVKLKNENHKNDPKAIKVTLNRRTIGYISRDQKSLVRKLTKIPNLVRAEIYGGPRKVYDPKKDKYIKSKDYNYTVRIYIEK
ncbi:hypothetical protein [Anaerococcus marasmi]|uniref:hypothetical protein n=1 Tax=Anaerococcus marasmi TaxID=2057797 RepID=UPI000CF9457B|nr:hypothetical protein [Anaerococcus marasmi]